MTFRSCLWMFLLATGPAAAEVPRLAATLTGTGAEAALLETSGGIHWYRPGSPIAGCTLARVEARRAWLDCNAGAVRIDLAGADDPKRSGTATPGAGQPLQIRLPPGLLARFAAQPQNLALAADFAPAVQQGQLVGWRVVALSPGGGLDGLGIVEGDIVTAVAGVPAHQPGSFTAVLRRLRDLGGFDCEILRQGRPITVFVSSPVKF